MLNEWVFVATCKKWEFWKGIQRNGVDLMDYVLRHENLTIFIVGEMLTVKKAR